MTFAVLGDVPYSYGEVLRVEQVIEELNDLEIDWVVHVGDILWYPCDDETILGRFELFSRLEHPFVYTPGDNEWTDCWERRLGGFDPLERLEFLRRTAFSRSTGSADSRPGNLLSWQSQADVPEWQEFVENRRWLRDGVLFVTAHMVGSWNSGEPFDGRTEAHDGESRRRSQAAVAWLESSFERARSDGAAAVVVAFHVAPGFLMPPGHERREGYEEFIAALEREAAGFDRPILLIHGDDHAFVVDQPLTDRETGENLEHVYRLQVMGSPQVGYVLVEVQPGDPEPFRYTPRHMLPGWRWLARMFGAG